MRALLFAQLLAVLAITSPALGFVSVNLGGLVGAKADSFGGGAAAAVAVGPDDVPQAAATVFPASFMDELVEEPSVDPIADLEAEISNEPVPMNLPSVPGENEYINRSPVKRGRVSMRMGGFVKEMFVVEAGRNGRVGPKLYDGMRLCPNTFKKRGFSIVCATEGKVHHINFLLNNKVVRTEINPPYTFAGDIKGRVIPWRTSRTGKVIIGCETQNHKRLKKTIYLSCLSIPTQRSKKKKPKTSKPHKVSHKRKPIKVPSSTKLKPVKIARQPTKLKSVKVPNPTKHKSKPVKTAKLRTKIKPVKVPHPTKQKPKLVKMTKPPKEFKPVANPMNMSVKKPTVTVKHKGKPALQSRKLKPKKGTLKSQPKKVIPRTPGARKGPVATGFKKKWCVWVNTKNYINTSNGATGKNGWSQVHNGVVYKKGFTGRRTFKPEHHLEYKFRAPATSHYAIVLDMSTKHTTEHNDAWINFPHGRGIRLRRRSSQIVRKGFVKVYHNNRGRALKSFSVDFRPHAISTADRLIAGETYKIVISGRSSKTEVHRVLLFPCKGGTCDDRSSLWKTYVQSC